MASELTVGEVVRRSGVVVSALHFYEARRLIGSHRTSGNQHRYARDVLRRVAVIRIAQDVGISLADIAPPSPPCPTDAYRSARIGFCFQRVGATTSTLYRALEEDARQTNRLRRHIYRQMLTSQP